MNACAHMATYWDNRARLYRSLAWFKTWELARFEARVYWLASIGITTEDCHG